MDENFKGDLSISIFGAPSGNGWDAMHLIWGTWLDTVFNNSEGVANATTFTHLAGYINFLAYVLISVVIAYTLLSSVVKTAAEGNVGGKDWDTVWVPARIFLACFLIFPVGIGNISMVQYIAVWLGGVGSNAGDSAANFVIANDKRSAFNIQATVEGHKVIADLSNMAFCALGFNDTLGDRYEKPSGSDVYGTVAGSKIDLSRTASTIISKNPLVSDYSTSDVMTVRDVAITTSLADDYAKINIGHNGECGIIAIKHKRGQEKLTKEIMVATIEAYQEVYVLAESLTKLGNAPTIKNALYEETTSKSTGIREAFDNATIRLKNMMDEYEDKIGDIIVSNVSQSDSRVILNKTDDGRIQVGINPNFFGDMGWFSLGTYDNMLNKSMDDIRQLTTVVNGVTKFTQVNGCHVYPGQDKGVVLKVVSWFTDDKSDCPFPDVNDITLLLNERLTAMLSADGNNMRRSFAYSCIDKNCNEFAIEGLIGNAISKAFSLSLKEYLLGDYAQFDFRDGANDAQMSMETGENKNSQNYLGAKYLNTPSVAFATVGHNMVITFNWLSVGLHFAAGTASALENNFTPIVGGVFAAFGGVIASILGSVNFILRLFIPTASALAYWVPIIPTVTWFFASVNWLVILSTAICAAPLAVVLMATPEGKGILGSRMDRNIALITSILLYPPLLVLGYQLSQAVTNIGFLVLVQTFDILGFTSVVDGLYAAVTRAMIFVFVSIILMANCAKLMVTVPESISEWFNGNMTKGLSNDFENSSQEFRSSMNDAKSVLGGGSGGIANAGGKAVGKSVGIMSRK